MKKVLASVQLAMYVSAGYRNTPNTWTLVGNDVDSTDNDLKITVTNWADENGDVLYMNVCANLLLNNLPDSQRYYWGLLFKPQSPVDEAKWDGVAFETTFYRNSTNANTGVNTAQHLVRDIWLDPASLSSSNTTSNSAGIVNGLPNVQGLGGKFINNYVDASGGYDWVLDGKYSWIYYNATT
jgi:hypothetical protein